MTNDFDNVNGNGPDIRIAEYVLGVLDAPARREVEAEIDTDPRLAERVAIWQVRFAELAGDVAPVDAPPHVWARILATMDDENARPRNLTPAPQTESLWNSLALWRWFGGVAVAATIVLAVVLATRPQPTATPAPAVPSLAATMVTDSGTPAFTASIDPDHRKVVIIPTADWAVSNRVPELWLIVPGQAPHSLGVIDSRRAMSVQIPANLQGYASASNVFAVTDEPPGGSPTGKPTGAIRAKGAIASI